MGVRRLDNTFLHSCGRIAEANLKLYDLTQHLELTINLKLAISNYFRVKNYKHILRKKTALDAVIK